MMGDNSNIKDKKSDCSLAAAGVFGVLAVTTALAGAAATNVSATTITTDHSEAVSVTVAASCTMTSKVDEAHTQTITPNQYSDDIGITSITITCNDTDGHAVYAVGYGNDTWNETRLLGANGNSISTSDRAGTTDASTPSHWYMKLYDASNISIQNSYDSYKAVPGGSNASDENGYVKVAAYTPNTGTPETTSFKTTYGVYANAAQASGSYSGKVKYTLVNPHMSDDKNKPKSKDPTPCVLNNAEYCMQNVADWGSSLVAGGSPVTAMDDRDGKEYSVARLADGKIWMTTNLDLAGGTALSSDTTNVDSSYIKNFSTSNNLTKTDDTIVLPESKTAGFNSNNYSFVYNSGSTTCGDNSPCYSYYSWDAATLGSGRSISTDNTNAPYSICPRGWHLPTTYNGTDDSTDFRALMIALGGSSATQTYNTSSNPTGKTISDALQASPNNFLLAGLYGNGSFYDGGSYGYYWSATSSSNAYRARYLYFDSTSVNSADNYNRYYGFSVRCVSGE